MQGASAARLCNGTPKSPGHEDRAACLSQHDSGSLHSLPAYSYLAKPFEPPGSAAADRSRQHVPACVGCADESAGSQGSSRMHTPSGSVHLPTPGSTPVPMSHGASHAAGNLEPPLSAALPETLDAALKSLQTSFYDGSSIPSQISSGEHPIDTNKPGPTTAGLPGTPLSDFGQRHSSDVELSGLVTNSVPRISSASSMPPLRKAPSQVSSQAMGIKLGAVPRPIAPMLPSPQLSHSWPPTTGGCAELRLPADGAGAAGADNPALQVRSCCLIASSIAQHNCNVYCHTSKTRTCGWSYN